MSTMEIRKLTKKEMPKVLKLHQYAYGFWSDQAVREEDLDFIIPENTIGVFDKKDLLSVLTIMKTKQSIRGVLKWMGGISMVGTYPEARMKGYTRSLMQTAFQTMKDEGFSVSMLEPFRETFYAKFGYVPAYEKYRLQAPLDGLRVKADHEIDDDLEIERVSGQEVKDVYMTFIQDFAPSAFHGYAFNPVITDEEWKRRNKDRHYVLVKKGGTIEALARFKFKGYMHFEEPGQLQIEEMYWRNLSAQAALFNFFSKHRDQFPKLIMLLPYGTNFQHWFEDLREWIQIKVWHPWMVRVIDIKEALAGLPATEKGELVFTLSDSQCEWNTGTYLLKSNGKQLQIQPTKQATKTALTIHGISALVYGTHSLEEIEDAQWLKGADKQTRKLLQNWFPQLSLYSPYTY
jgi:predicted acetyltransferase